MLLTKVGLKNFMKHESLDVDLEAGMNVIRGSNEAGKSSLLTGIAYNWFGAGALPQTVDDTVTWGAKKSAMKTKTDFTIGEDYYVCYRSISGAELYKGDAETISGTPLVTGHKEVSAAIANLFDLPSVNAAFELQIASQNSVRGVISLGATAAAAFIEKLIDMSDIDDMIKDVSEKLTHNNESKKQALENVESFTTELSNLAKPASTKKLENEVAILQGKLTSSKESAEVTRLDANDAEFAFRELETSRRNAESKITALSKEIEVLKSDLKLPEESISEDDVADASVLLNRWIKYDFYTDEFLPLVNSRPEQEWDGDQKSFDDYVEGLERAKNRCLTEATELRAEHRVLQSQIITETTCPTCGHELVDLKKTEKRNADLVAKQDNLTVKIDKYVVDAEETGLLIKEANVLSVFQRKQELWLAKNRQRVSVTTDTVPHRISILGELPVKPADPMSQRVFDEMVQKKAGLDEQVRSYDAKVAKHDALLMKRGDAGRSLLELAEQLPKLKK